MVSGLASLRAYPGFAIPEFHNPERVAARGRNSATPTKDRFEAKFARASEVDDPPHPRQLIHNLLSAGLIAWAISANHTPKLSRTTRLTLWAFGMGYLSRIALDSATPKVTSLVTYSNRW
jgi:hypothetical protein